MRAVFLSQGYSVIENRLTDPTGYAEGTMRVLRFATFSRLLMVFVCVTCLQTALSNTSVAQADDLEVDVQLVLAVDVSRSMSPPELEIQRRGYAEALVSDEVVSAIQSGLLGRVAITYIEWAGAFSQRTVVGWSLISNRAEAQAFANQITAHFEDALRRTSISGGLEFAATLFDGNGFASNRRIIDVSGDGPNNQGRPVLMSREEVLQKGIIINGLPLMTEEGAGGFLSIRDLDAYYTNCVIGGPGSFMLPVLSWEQFPTAVRQKLVLELAAYDPAPVIRAEFTKAANPDYDCLIGEKLWQIFRGQLFQP
ncbi:MAG: DUF1194 domain-containing protein [Pseudomonadota bacterium]